MSPPPASLPPALHGWDVSAGEARRLQDSLRKQVVLKEPATPVRHIAGVDCGFEDQGRITRAVVAVFGYPALTPEHTVVARRATSFPYIPGLLSFREIPAVLDAMAQLPQLPDLLLCDGQGIAHPRRMGIATHLGLWLDLPSIGVGKSRLVGHFTEPGTRRGDATELMDKGERIGTVLRSRDHVRPLFVSPGHRMSHGGAVQWVLNTLGRYRLPEPIRQADRVASRRGSRPGKLAIAGNPGGDTPAAGPGD